MRLMQTSYVYEKEKQRKKQSLTYSKVSFVLLQAMKVTS